MCGFRVEVFGQAFFKKLVGFGAKPHGFLSEAPWSLGVRR